MLNKIFVATASLYLTATVASGTAALLLTLWAYNIDDRMVSDIVTATIRNMAAALAAMGFFGGGDMFFTIWQFLRNQEAEKARNQEREEERQARRTEQEQQRAEQEEERQARRAEREQQRMEREEHRAERAEFIALLQAERARNEALTAHILELTELVINRNNGDGANGRDGNGNAGPSP